MTEQEAAVIEAARIWVARCEQKARAIMAAYEHSDQARSPEVVAATNALGEAATALSAAVRALPAPEPREETRT